MREMENFVIPGELLQLIRDVEMTASRLKLKGNMFLRTRVEGNKLVSIEIQWMDVANKYSYWTRPLSLGLTSLTSTSLTSSSLTSTPLPSTSFPSSSGEPRDRVDSKETKEIKETKVTNTRSLATFLGKYPLPAKPAKTIKPVQPTTLYLNSLKLYDLLSSSFEGAREIALTSEQKLRPVSCAVQIIRGKQTTMKCKLTYAGFDLEFEQELDDEEQKKKLEKMLELDKDFPDSAIADGSFAAFATMKIRPSILLHILDCLYQHTENEDPQVVVEIRKNCCIFTLQGGNKDETIKLTEEISGNFALEGPFTLCVPLVKFINLLLIIRELAVEERSLYFSLGERCMLITLEPLLEVKRDVFILVGTSNKEE